MDPYSSDSERRESGRRGPTTPHHETHDIRRIGTGRVSPGAEAVIVTEIPIVDPFPHVPDHIVQAESIRLIRADFSGPIRKAGMCHSDRRVFRSRCLRLELITPWEELLIHPSASSTFPFGFGRETLARPPAKRVGVVPTNVVDGKSLSALRVFRNPMVRLPMTSHRDKPRVIGVRHLITVHVISVEVHQMHRPIIPLIVFSPAQFIHQSHSEATHPELTVR